MAKGAGHKHHSKHHSKHHKHHSKHHKHQGAHKKVAHKKVKHSQPGAGSRTARNAGFRVLKDSKKMNSQSDFNKILAAKKKGGAFFFDGIINSANEKLIDAGASGIAKWCCDGMQGIVNSSQALVNDAKTDCTRGNAVAQTAWTKPQTIKQFGRKTRKIPSRKMLLVHAICMRKYKGGVRNPGRTGRLVQRSFCEAIKKAANMKAKRVFVKTMGSRHGYSTIHQGKTNAKQKLRNRYFLRKMWEGFQLSGKAKQIEVYVYQAKTM